MSPVSPWIVLCLSSALLLEAWLVLPRKREATEVGRFAAIDGLRGYLAFGVFLHHSCIWFFYLLHGLLLFVTFRFVVGFENAGHFSAMQHWALIAGLIAPLLLLTRLSFERIERPGMRAVDGVMARLRRRRD